MAVVKFLGLFKKSLYAFFICETNMDLPAVTIALERFFFSFFLYFILVLIGGFQANFTEKRLLMLTS